LREALRSATTDGRLETDIVGAVAAKPAGHCFGMARVKVETRPMHQLGG
jgi:molybdenum cofactor biosynthesis enzyme MoaA